MIDLCADENYSCLYAQTSRYIYLYISSRSHHSAQMLAGVCRGVVDGTPIRKLCQRKQNSVRIRDGDENNGARFCACFFFFPSSSLLSFDRCNWMCTVCVLDDRIAVCIFIDASLQWRTIAVVRDEVLRRQTSSDLLFWPQNESDSALNFFFLLFFRVCRITTQRRTIAFGFRQR